VFRWSKGKIGKSKQRNTSNNRKLLATKPASKSKKGTFALKATKGKHGKKSQRKAASRQITKRAKPTGAKANAVQTYEIPDSYYHALVKGIESDLVSAENSVTLESVIFTKLLAFSKLGKKEQYNSGFRIGKLYFSSLNHAPYGRWYKESIPALVSFFAKLGYFAAYRNSPSGNPTIKLSAGEALKFGFNMHEFESGIISGFLSRAKGSYVGISEMECSLNGSEECVFVEGNPKPSVIEVSTIAKRFSQHLTESYIKKLGSRGKFSPFYNAMMLASMKHVKAPTDVMTSLGNYTRIAFDFPNMPERLQIRSTEQLVRIISVASKSDESPKSMKLWFDAINSDSNYLDSISRFVTGLTNGNAKISRSISDSGLGYSLELGFDAKLLKLKNK